MKSLKSVRLVYRQHLLPPIVLPFDKTNSFLNTLGGLTGEKNEIQKKKKEKLSQINDTIIQQVLKYKEHFITPLKTCPFYYDIFDKVVQTKLFGSRVEGKYVEAAKLLSITTKMSIYRQFQKQFIKFQKKLEKENLPLLKKIKFVPIFIFDSHEDYLRYNRKKESELSDLQKEKSRTNYQKKLRNHWEALQDVAKQSGLSVEELLNLEKRQIDPELPEGLKALLFN